MQTFSQQTQLARHLFIATATFAIITAFPVASFGQAAEQRGGGEHAETHGMTPLNLSEADEVDESDSLVSADSPTTVSVKNIAFNPEKVTVPQGQTVRWNFQDNNTDHTVTDTTAMGLFDSGKRSFGDSFPFVFNSAGIYPYHCEIHSTMQGAVQVPIKVSPLTGSPATSFNITWSSAPAPAGFVFDVQIKRPGTTAFVNWKTGLTKRRSAFTAGDTGKYSFRARLRKVNNDARSLYSPFRTITVVK